MASRHEPENVPLQTYNANYNELPKTYPRDGQVSLDVEGVARAQGGVPGGSHYDRNPRGHTRYSSEDGEGLRQRTPSTRSQQEERRELIQRLPSQQLVHRVSQVVKSDTWRRKSKKQRPGFATLRHRGQQLDVGQVANDLLHSEDFVDQGPAEQAENIRDLPMTLSNKKLVREQVEKSRDTNQKRPGWFKRMRYNTSLAWRNFKDNMAELRYSMELWKGHMKVIEGNFGTGVTSYFVFLKWLFLFNIPMFLLLFCFVTLPMILYRWLEQEPSGYTDHGESFTGEELLTGGGWFNNTELYYGYYLNGTIEIIDGHKYDMQYAYLCTMGAFYIVAMFVVLVSLSQSYIRNYIEGSGDLGLYHISKVFGGWDYSITAPKTATLKHKSIFKEFQEHLSGFHEDDVSRTCGAWCSLLLFRLFTNLVVLGLLAGCGYLLWYISVTQTLSNDLDFISELALPLCVSAINFILPIAFSILASFEAYSKPQHELYITMIRTIVLNGVTLGVLVYFWFNSVNCAQRDDDDAWLDEEMKCYPCWETFLGMEIYKLIIMDFIFTLLITFFTEFIRKLMARFCCPALGYPEFNIARNTLSLVYSQVLVWLGSYYSPLLSVIMILKLFIIFYVKRASVVQNCIPSVKPWRAGRTHTIIMALLFLAFLFCFGAQAYSIFFMTPSQVCGPYIGKNSSFDVITDLADQYDTSGTNFFKVLLEIITSVAFLAFILIGLGVAAHFSRTASNGYGEMVKLLKHQIALEGKDKMFLLRLLQEASKAQGERRYHDVGCNITTGGDTNIPRRKTLDPRPQSHAQPISSQSENFNQGYTARSYDDDDDNPAVVMDPAGGSGAVYTGTANNPAYSEGSPTHAPTNLPYPQQQYSMYKKPQ